MPLGAVSDDRAIRRRKSSQFRFDIGPREYSEFIQGVRLGLPIEDAAYNARLTPRRVFDWLKKGELYDEVFDDLVSSSPAWQYARFWQDYTYARANMTARHVANIDHCSREPAASSGQWMASKYMLSVKNPEKWSERHQIEKLTNQKVLEIIKFLFENGDESFRETLASLVQLLPSIKLGDAVAAPKPLGEFE
jgi:hypothetical protein